MNGESYRRILKEKGNKTGTLNLAEMDLMEIPADIQEMSWIISLDLSGNQISEIENLQSATKLQNLRLSGNQITDIKNLESLTSLQSLVLSVNQITEIKNLENLTSLQSLVLYGNQISEIKNLESLTKLQSLYLSHNQITEIKNLESLTSLQALHLYHNEIIEIKNLKRLPNLQVLDLSINRITEIKNLKSLTSLQKLNLSYNQITEIKNLESLTRLQLLDLSRNKITEIKNLENFSSLQKLNLSGNQITEIKNLDSLTTLQSLNLSRNQLTEVNKLSRLVNTESLEALYLFGIVKNSLHIPIENFGLNHRHNCLPLLKAYFEATKKGASYSREVPIILVGNSTVGKTSLLHFMKEKRFPPPNDYSTHGIEPDLWHPPDDVLEAFDDMGEMHAIQFYLWDFGGQEYYHATHRLFFSKEAVYVVVWDKATNKNGTEVIPIRLKLLNGVVKEMLQTVELFPFTYWLDTVRFFCARSAQSTNRFGAK